MKSFGTAVLSVFLGGVMVFTACSSGPKRAAQAAAPQVPGGAYHIGIVTGPASGDDFQGAEDLVWRYGSVDSGGIIRHITYPDDFMDRREETIAGITALAADPQMKVIIVNQGIPGTAEAFRRIREQYPDMLLFAGGPHEDPLLIQQTATLAVSADFISRGYTIPWAAKELGADTFVHISFPRHMNTESLGLRRQIFEEACADLGLNFVSVSAPDPESGGGAARQYILDQTPRWTAQYGKNAAFFCTDAVHAEPLVKQLLVHGGFFVEADLPSPLTGYPGALEIDLSADAGNFPAILRKIEGAVMAKGGTNRFGAWSYSFDYAASAGLGEFAKRVLEGKASIDSAAGLYAALAVFTAGAKWNGAYYVDHSTGIRARNHLLVYMDTYIFGRGYLPTAFQTVPEKYYHITFQKPD
jgi:hypothetical protein